MLWALMVLVAASSGAARKTEAHALASDAGVDSGSTDDSDAGTLEELPGFTVELQGDPTTSISLSYSNGKLEGTLRFRNETFPLIEPKLEPVWTRDWLRIADGKITGSLRAEYRLKFTFDECLHAQQVSTSQWPGLCGYWPGQERPKRMASWELFVLRDGNFFESGHVQTFEASCIPSSALGPSCHLTGVETVLKH